MKPEIQETLNIVKNHRGISAKEIVVIFQTMGRHTYTERVLSHLYRLRDKHLKIERKEDKLWYYKSD